VAKTYAVLASVLLVLALTWPGEANTRYNGLPVALRDAIVRVITPDGHVGSGVVTATDLTD